MTLSRDAARGRVVALSSELQRCRTELASTKDALQGMGDLASDKVRLDMQAALMLRELACAQPLAIPPSPVSPRQCPPQLILHPAHSSTPPPSLPPSPPPPSLPPSLPPFPPPPVLSFHAGACQEGYIELAQWLRAEGAAVDATSMAGEQPLHAACQEGYTNVARRELARG